MHRAAQGGYTCGVGEVCFGVGPKVLRWIAEHLTGDMITFDQYRDFRTHDHGGPSDFAVAHAEEGGATPTQLVSQG